MTRAYLDPLRDEISRLRAELALALALDSTCEEITAYTGEHGDIVTGMCARSAHLTRELALVNDTLRHRTESHGRLVRDRLACPHCSTLPIEETPSDRH